jgi:hypothetical protein
MSTALRFLPPLEWSALIAWFSGAGFSAASTASLLVALGYVLFFGVVAA